MNARDFLSAVLPADGYLIFATPFPNGGYIQRAVSQLDVALAHCNDWVWECRDVYFALASFEKPKVWNPKKINRRTGEIGAWESRSQANVKLIRSLFLDIDVKPDDKHYPDQAAALVALHDLCKQVGLPRPMLVSSGYGLHVYWPFTEAVPPDVWKPVAEKLQSVVVHCGLLNDTGIITDSARVLRVPGTINFKRNSAVPVELLMASTPHPLALLDTVLSAFIVGNNVSVTHTRPRKELPAPTGPMAGVEGNLGATNNPLNPDLLVFGCPAFRKQVATRGAKASEPQWYAALALAKFCEPQRETLLAVSDGYPAFTEAGLQDKLLNLSAAPPTCAKIWGLGNQSICESCPSWRKIKSPASLGTIIREQPPLQVNVSANPQVPVVLPTLPGDYKRTTNKENETIIIAEIDNSEGGKHAVVVCPYDFYPRRVLRQVGIDDVVEESSVWVTNLPRMGEIEFKMPQGLLSDTRKLHAFLLSRGMHINSNEAKTTQVFMTAYLKQLTRAIDREKVYERLGWHEKYQCFVLPNIIYFRDGSVMSHQPTSTMKAVTKEAIHPEGTHAEWMDAMTFYVGKGKAGYRQFVYGSFGAPIFHMTGHKGVLLTAAGDTGRGKTTLLEACASVWGDPEPMLVSGGQDGSTVNAWYTMIGTYHSLPFFWDDTTERDAEEMRKFILHIPQGKGKERMYGNVHDGKVVTWETIVMSSTNTDDVNRIMASGKNVDPHLMRLISIEFDSVDRGTEAKIVADKFRRRIRSNFGHGGPIYIRYIATHYEEVQKRVLTEMEKLDREVGAESQERYWSAAVAAMIVGGEIAFELSLLPFNPRDDYEWMIRHIRHMRVTHMQIAATAADVLDEFMNVKLPNTLIIAPKSASNIDNIAHEPRGAMYIRHEVDSDRAYISRQAIAAWCAETKANETKLESELIATRVILRHNCHKVLGADTKFAAGQTRCWEIDMVKLRELTKKGV